MSSEKDWLQCNLSVTLHCTLDMFRACFTQHSMRINKLVTQVASWCEPVGNSGNTIVYPLVRVHLGLPFVLTVSKVWERNFSSLLCSELVFLLSRWAFFSLDSPYSSISWKTCFDVLEKLNASFRALTQNRNDCTIFFSLVALANIAQFENLALSA